MALLWTAVECVRLVAFAEVSLGGRFGLGHYRRRHTGVVLTERESGRQAATQGNSTEQGTGEPSRSTDACIASDPSLPDRWPGDGWVGGECEAELSG